MQLYLPLWDDQYQKAALVAAAVSVGCTVYWYALSKFRFFKGTGIPGPSPKPLTGNLGDLKRHGYQLHLQIDEYYKKYGSVFGFYYHNEPVLVISEEEIVQDVLKRQASKFKNRKFVQELPWPCGSMITMAKNEDWKSIRNLLSPFFTTKSLSSLFPFIHRSLDTFADKLQKASDDKLPVDIVSLCQGFIMEFILRVAFSIDCPNQSDLNLQLVRLANDIMQPPQWSHSVSMLPFGKTLVKNIPSAFRKKLRPLIDIALSVVGGRRAEKSKSFEDILQALLKAQESGVKISDHILRGEEILAQGLALLTAVMEMTSNALSAMFIEISNDQDVQQRIYKDVSAPSLGDVSPFPTWQQATEGLKYIDLVIQEVLRLYTPAFILMRECTEACESHGIRFNKGQAVFIPISSMHRDSKVWSNPEQFNPDRFSEADAKSMHGYMPFGHGPRMCLGYRLAEVELKTAIARIVKRFKLVQTTPFDRAMNSHISVQATVSFSGPVHVRVYSRE